MGNGDDEFIERVIHKNNEAGVRHNLGQTRKCMVEFLEQNPYYVRHPDGLLFWARESEKRAECLHELRNDEEALRKYLVVNEPQQKFLELWRMSQIQVLRDIKERPMDVFHSESARGVRYRRSRAGTLPCRLQTIIARQESLGSVGILDTLKEAADLNEVSQRRSIHITPNMQSGLASPYPRSRGGSVYRRTRSRKASCQARSRKGSTRTNKGPGSRSRKGSTYSSGSLSRSRVGSTLSISPTQMSPVRINFMADSPSRSRRRSLFSKTRQNSYREYIYSANDSGRSTPSQLP